ATERMTFVDSHQEAFASHGACARAADDPPFDRECFSGKGDTFESSLTKGAVDPMTCGYPASQFRPYASRARWIRTANDSYFTAPALSGAPALAAAAEAPARCDVGHLRRGLWRRHSPPRRGPRCHGRRRGAGDARGAGPAGADASGAQRAAARVAATAGATNP